MDTIYTLADNQKLNLEAKFSLSKFPNLNQLSLVFKNAFVSGRYHQASAILIPKQIEILKMDRIYCNTNDELQLPIVIENDSVLHTLEINCSYSIEMVNSEIEINNFIEILNLCITN